MSEREQKKNQVVGILSSVGIHLMILLLFLFVMGWTAPDPPLSELGSGVELNFGLDQEGTGDVQPAVTAGAAKQEAVKTEEQKPDVLPESKTEVKEEDTKPVDEKLSSKDENAVEVPEVKKEVKKKEPVKEKAKEVTPKENPANETKKEKKEVKDAPIQKEAAESTKNATGTSQGNDKNKTGDKGKPEGSLDPNAQYTGKPGTGGAGNGGGGGGGISFSGFDGFAKPKIAPPEVPEDSYGTYIFLVKVDDKGDIVKITPQNRGLSLEAEKIFKKLIEGTEFVPTKDNMPAYSEGTITFKIVAGKRN